MRTKKKETKKIERKKYFVYLPNPTYQMRMVSNIYDGILLLRFTRANTFQTTQNKS